MSKMPEWKTPTTEHIQARLELRECASMHQRMADNFKYEVNPGCEDIKIDAERMTTLMRWQHKRWAELIRLAAEKV